MDASKVSCMVNWPTPQSIKEVRGFLGLTGYYRRFIRGYGSIAKPLTDLLKKGAFQWGTVAQDAFDKLKQAMVTAPVLALPKFSEEFVVESDASHQGIGAILSQNGRPLAYFSKILSARHQALSVYEKEMLAILMAVKKWSSYLVGRHFKIKTDHQSLKFLLDQKTCTPAQQQWVIKMMGFDYEVVYRKGNTNTAADALSRKPHGAVQAITFCQTELLDKIKKTWTTDPALVQLISKLQAGQLPTTKYVWHNDQLRRKGKLVVGDEPTLRLELLKLFHCSVTGGHSGSKQTMARIGNILYWKGLKK